MSTFKKQKGFTLIEIVMVIILLGILAAVAAPKFLDLSTGAHDAALDGVYAAYNSALSIAIAKNKKVPSETDGANGFDTLVDANVILEGGVSTTAGTWNDGADNDGGTSDLTFDIASGVSGGGRSVTLTYVVESKSPALTMGTPADIP